MKVDEFGYSSFRTRIGHPALQAVRESAFAGGEAGVRCLLDNLVVRDVAMELRQDLVAAGHLPAGAVAIQAIAFDKNPTANWKVTWHQDVMFPFARRVAHAGFELPSRKDGADYARPPRKILEDLLAVRLHLDDCDESNGPLRVSPGTHRHGVFRSAEIQEQLRRHGEVTCISEEGSALLMKPLLLHASSPATAPRHRRVLHIVFYSGAPIPEPWYRAI